MIFEEDFYFIAFSFNSFIIFDIGMKATLENIELCSSAGSY